jgi:hypothetical protein
MKRYLAILFFLICFREFSKGNKAIKYDSILYLGHLRLMAMDSCGDVRIFPSNTVFSINFLKFGNKKLKLNRLDRYAKRKQNWTGVFYIYSDMKNRESVLWCGVKGYFKIEGNKITLSWNDNFKVQEHFYEFTIKVGSLFQDASNATGVIEKNGANEIILNMKQTNYKKDPICIKFVISKVETLK